MNSIFRGMNIHLPAILMFTRGTRFWHTAISPSCRSHHFWLVKRQLASRMMKNPTWYTDFIVGYIYIYIYMAINIPWTSWLKTRSKWWLYTNQRTIDDTQIHEHPIQQVSHTSSTWKWVCLKIGYPYFPLFSIFNNNFTGNILVYPIFRQTQMIVKSHWGWYSRCQNSTNIHPKSHFLNSE